MNQSNLDKILDNISTNLNNFQPREQILYKLVQTKLENSVNTYNNELNSIYNALLNNKEQILEVVNEYIK